MGGLGVLAASEDLPPSGRSAVVPGGLDEQPAGVAAAGLGDRSLAALLAAGVLRRGQADVNHQLPGALEPSSRRARNSVFLP